MRMVHVLVSYEDEVVMSQWMCYLNAFSGIRMVHVLENYEDEVVVSQWMCYLHKKTVNPNLEQLVRCFKYNTDITREISSFRITPPEEYFSSLLDTNLWPDGTLVKEFLPRSNANSLQIPAKN